MDNVSCGKALRVFDGLTVHAGSYNQKDGNYSQISALALMFIENDYMEPYSLIFLIS